MNSQKMFACVVVAVWAFVAFPVDAIAGDYISLKKIELNADDAQTLYVGRGTQVEITFKNSGRPDWGFNEPPFLIGRMGGAEACEAGEDGGIWKADGVYFSKDERLIVVRAYSGSNEFYEFYDVGSCKKLMEIDVSKVELKAGMHFKNRTPQQLRRFVDKR